MKKIILVSLLFLTTSLCFSQVKNYQLSSHILDNSTGMPASSVTVTLQKLNNDKTWSSISTQKTDKDGRISNFLPYEKNNDGIYKLVFETLPYFQNKNIESFYPFIEIIFSIKGNSHYHVPLTLSPFGYSTYKGS